MMRGLFAATWFELQPHPPKYFPAIALGLGALLVLAGILAQQKRTYLFDTSLQRLKWTCSGLFKSGAMPFSDIVEVRLESLSDSDGGQTYRAALVTPAGLMPLSNAYTGNKQKVAEFAYYRRAWGGGRMTKIALGCRNPSTYE